MSLSKVCSQCKGEKPLKDFNKSSKSRDGYKSYCRLCGKKYDEFSRRVKTRYGITAEELKALEEDQQGKCKTCGSDGPLVVDHDHSCCPGSKACGKCVRGLLCSNCNTALGLLNEDLRRLASLTIYLLDYETEKASVIP